MFGGQAAFTADSVYMRLTQYTSAGIYLYDAMFKVTSHTDKPGNVTQVTITCVDTNGNQYIVNVPYTSFNKQVADSTGTIAVTVRTLSTAVYPRSSLQIPVTIGSKVPLSQCSASFLVRAVDGGTYTANAPAVSAS